MATTLSTESIQKIINDEIQKIIPILQKNITEKILNLVVVQETICPTCSKKQIPQESSSSSEEEQLVEEEEHVPPPAKKIHMYSTEELNKLKIVDLKNIANERGVTLLKTDKKVDIIKKIKSSQTKPLSKEKEFLVIKNEFGVYVDKDTQKYIIDRDTNSVIGIYKSKGKHGVLTKKDISDLEEQKIPLYHIKLKKNKPLTIKEIGVYLESLKPKEEEKLEESEDTSEEEQLPPSIVNEGSGSETDGSESSGSFTTTTTTDDEGDDGSEKQTDDIEGDEIKIVEDVFKKSFKNIIKKSEKETATHSKTEQEIVPKKQVVVDIPPKKENIPPPKKQIIVPKKENIPPPKRKLLKKKVEDDSDSD